MTTIHLSPAITDRMHILFQQCELAEVFCHMDVSVLATTTPHQVVDRITLANPEPADMSVAEAVALHQERPFLSNILAASVDFHTTGAAGAGGIYTTIFNTLLANSQCQKYGINGETFPHNPEDIHSMNSLARAIFDLHERITKMDPTFTKMAVIIHVNIGNSGTRLGQVKDFVRGTSAFWNCMNSLLHIKYAGLQALNKCPRVYFIYTGTGLNRLPWSFSGSLPTNMLFV
jgi:hypothetical protein